MSELMDKIKSGPPRRRKTGSPPPLDAETAIEWAVGSISLSQIGRELYSGKKGTVVNTSIYRWAAFSLREAIVKGLLIKKDQ